MKIAERVVMILLLIFILGGVIWIYFAVQYEQKEIRDEQKEILDAVHRREYEIPLDDETKDIAPEDWQKIYPTTVPIIIGTTTVRASVADSLPERIQGLSDTPFLPDNFVKLFVFGVYGEHSIWMKNMNYSLDIIWMDKEGKIVHIEENVSPDTYPQSFNSPIPAWYVIEANSGFVEENDVEMGDIVTLY